MPVFSLMARPPIAIIVSGLIGFIGAAAVGLGIQIHEPRVHDEFSYLLAADTFARGRLTNEPHPMWEHFESYHINQQPTYASKYPPAQGLFLAAGQVLTGLPIVGVWLSAALLSASICWMLLAWFPPRWALFGGILSAVQYGIVGPWAQGYWGGAVAALGGALLLGAVPRIVREGRVRDSLLMGVGISILANSRPYEGLIICIPVAVVLGAYLGKQKLPSLRGTLLRVVLPAAVILLTTFSWMAYYNFRVTGHALTTPYLVNDRAYMPMPTFLFGALPSSPPQFRHPDMREAYAVWARLWYENPGPPSRWPSFVSSRMVPHWNFYLGILWTLPLVALPWVLRDRWMGFCFAVLAVGLISQLLPTSPGGPHYIAPVTGAVVALIVASLERLAALRGWGWPIGRGVVAGLALWALFDTARAMESHAQAELAWNRQRASFAADEPVPTKHLVIVRYGADHDLNQEWVYNAADIDGAQVVWARTMGPEKDRALIDYFSDRRAWLFEVRATGIRGYPYPVAPRTQPAEPQER